MNKTFIALLLFLLPAISHAQTVQLFFENLLLFINHAIIPFLFGMAFLIFAVNVVRFFVLGSSNQEGQEKAKALALYSVLAFVILIVFWGIVNMLSTSLGLEGCIPVESDYIENSSPFNSLSPTCT